jgi:hypothetical protein
MTNQEVIQMVRTGVPEVAILASIQRSTPKFDLSANGLALLKQAGVSEAIVLAMLRAAWAAPSGMPQVAGVPSPTPAGGTTPGKTSKRLTPQQRTALLARIHSVPAKPGPIISNPAAGQANTSTLATLQQQKQTALNERGQAPPPAATSGGTQSPAYSRASAPAAASRMAAPPPPASGGSLVNRPGLGNAASSNLNIACGSFNSPIVTAVSGQSGSAAIFTQDPAYNPFTIKGCYFGSSKGQAQLNLPSGRKLADLTIDSWTDNLITVEVDPSLLDVLDLSNVTLVLFPANGPQVQKSGFRFSAMRRELLLSSIPASEASLSPTNDDEGNPITMQYSSPSQGASAAVDRYNGVRFPGGTDVFDFSKLKPGFVVEKFQVTPLNNSNTNPGCGQSGPSTTTFYIDGSWAWQMAGNTIRVSWQETHCHDAYQGDASDSSYGLNVWVLGPAVSANTNPWQDGLK